MELNRKLIAPFEANSFVNVNHSNGLKNVFFTSLDCVSNITQVALGKLNANEKIERHQHLSMEEFFFLLDGECEFVIDNETFILKPKDNIRIPPNSIHTLKALSDIDFFYFGVSV